MFSDCRYPTIEPVKSREGFVVASRRRLVYQGPAVLIPGTESITSPPDVALVGFAAMLLCLAKELKKLGDGHGSATGLSQFEIRFGSI